MTTAAKTPVMDPSPSDPVTIGFTSVHVPPLERGEYTLTLAHSNSAATPPQPFTRTFTFRVHSERFSIRADEVHKVFPPDGSDGDFSAVLPHVLLSRSTLPWERSAATSADPTKPWLALLVIDVRESPPPRSNGDAETAFAAQAQTSGAAPFLSYALNPSPSPQSKAQGPQVRYIDVPADLWNRVAPSKDDLPFLCHVRDKVVDGVTTAYATVVANRLPAPGSTTVVHLVSLEGLYDALPLGSGSSRTGGLDAKKYQAIRLASLVSYRFTVGNFPGNFADVLASTNHSVLRADGSRAEGVDACLRVPAPRGVDHSISDRLSLGYVALGDARAPRTSGGWYRGPLIPPGAAPLVAAVSPPVDHAAQLDAASAGTPLPDVSLSAAWEVGRLHALADLAFATAQVTWKRTCRVEMVQAQRLTLPSSKRSAVRAAIDLALKTESTWQAVLGTGLVAEGATGGLALPAALHDGLRRIAQLQGVPFHYLVPDPRMSPPESVRFFDVDATWVRALLDGAWSLGREPSALWAFDATYDPWSLLAGDVPKGGALIRSSVVSSYWPDIVVKGYPGADRSQPAKQLRLDRVGPSTLLVLFDQAIQTLVVEEPPEGVHFGFAPNPTTGPLSFTKTLRLPSPSTTAPIVPLTVGEDRRIPIQQLAAAIHTALETAAPTTMDAAQLAYQLIQGVPAVEFQLESPGRGGQ